MGMGFAPTWLRQVSPLASQKHFVCAVCAESAVKPKQTK